MVIPNTQSCVYVASTPKGTLACSEKTYATVVSGSQTWLAENLAWLPRVDNDTARHVAKYYVPNYVGTSVAEAMAWPTYAEYGVLYNFKAAQAACPQGWHLPDSTEWKTLFNLVGTTQTGKLKATTGWVVDSINGTDDYGFGAIPAGYRNLTNVYLNKGYWGYWWTSTVMNGDEFYMTSWQYYMGSSKNSLYKNWGDFAAGASVRCLKD